MRATHRVLKKHVKRGEISVFYGSMRAHCGLLLLPVDEKAPREGDGKAPPCSFLHMFFRLKSLIVFQNSNFKLDFEQNVSKTQYFFNAEIEPPRKTRMF